MGPTRLFDYDFQPETFWPLERPEAGRTKSEADRQLQEFERTGDPSALRMPPVPFALQGGNFLPDFKGHTVEIARISLQSTTWDVISFRATPGRGRIRYSWHDEYGTDLKCSRKTSRRPLKLRQLIQAIDSLKGETDMSPWGLRDSCDTSWGGLENIREAASFVTVSSEFYPQLGDHYDQEAEEWLQGRMEDLESDASV